MRVATGRNHVDHYRRNDDGTWMLHTHGDGGVVRLSRVEVALPVDAIYEGVSAVRETDAGGAG